MAPANPQTGQLTGAAPNKGARKTLIAFVSAAGLALGGMFFVSRPLIGLLLWSALALNLRYAAFAVLGLIVGGGVKKLLRVSGPPGLGGGLQANALLAAVTIAWMSTQLGTSLSTQLLIAAVSAAAAAIVTAAVIRALSGTGLPTLVSGYCIIAVGLFTICPTCTILSANAMPPWLQPNDAIGWIYSFVRSMGSLLYLADIKAGAIIILALLFWSRAMFFAGTVGWISGVCTAIAFQQLNIPYYFLPVSYNYFIVGMALGAVVFLPGWASLLAAALAGCAASFLALALQYWMHGGASAYLPITSIITIWVGVGAISLAGDRFVLWRNSSPQLPPEETWWHSAYLSQRFGHARPLMTVPVAGPLRISQGFDSALSHVGPWRHALDFQQYPTSEAGSPTLANSLWGLSVIAPAAGIVERIRNDVPDNELGLCNYADNWGNFIVIRLDQGGWALLAHLRQGSIVVSSGARVETGTYLGQVGNSGRSVAPHLHLQFQKSPEPGSPTTPFRLANYLSADQAGAPWLHWHASGEPSEGNLIMAASANPSVYGLLSSMMPGSAVWAVELHGHIPHTFQPSGPDAISRITMTIDTAGHYVFAMGEKDTLVFRLDPDAWRVAGLHQVEAPLLKLLRLAAPTIPYAATTGMTWIDLAPIMPACFIKELSLSLGPYRARPFPALHCQALAVLAPNHHVLEIETKFERPHSPLPLKLICQFDKLRGPVKLQADFDEGFIVYSQISFEPREPRRA